MGAVLPALYKVISSGSKGNAVIYFNSILVDCGVPFALLKPFLYDIQAVLLTHKHGDHFKRSTIARLVSERPSLRVGCCDWLADRLDFVRNLDVYKTGRLYDYGAFKVSPVKLYHDIPTCGYRIFKDGKKIFHATDTAHLEGITAKNYDLYAIESNYNEDTVYETISELEARGEFAHQRGSLNTHLSEQQSRDFIFKNRGEHSRVLRLHESTSFL